jgi:hypothetical protein
MATVASHKRLFTHYQKDGVDNHTYHRGFLTHVVKQLKHMAALVLLVSFLPFSKQN